MENFWLSKREKEIQARVDAAIAAVRQDMESEYNRRVDECYEEAYSILTEYKQIIERKEAILHEEFEKKLKEQKDSLIDKVDQYLKSYLLTLSDKQIADFTAAKVVEEALK